MVTNLSLLIFVILAVIAFRGIADWLIYTVKSGAKQANVSKIGWLIAFMSAIADIYYLMNGWKW